LKIRQREDDDEMAGNALDQTCIVRAWDMRKPLLLAPAMNTHMWAHPLTARQILEVELIGYRVIPPIAKRLACGDVGVCATAKS
jgi:phosphopantothenoylcysteine decarboxylase